MCAPFCNQPSSLAEDSLVNFERSARVGDEIGGHTVSGHIQTTATMVSVDDSANNRRLTFELKDSKWSKYILPKASMGGWAPRVGVSENRGAFCPRGMRP